ncbi:MAG TPA: single-stranded DNA-binding protein [Candidatus Gracilibacteria bacterium]|nr:single-stranded DNA-binding protein [Candidatus Gracilibacteria bacterium]
MYSLNHAQIIGHLTAKPEVNKLDSGVAVSNLDIEVKSKIQSANGPITVSSFITAVLWRRLAEIASEYLDKGSEVYVSGRLETDSWEDQQGNKKYRTKLITDDMIILSPKSGTLPPLNENLQISGGLNKTEIIGNLTKDPELRTTPNGSMVSSFGVATSRAWKTTAGESQEKTEFHNVVVWGDLAEEVSKHLVKGRKVYISGRLQTRSWESPTGEKRYTTEIVAEQVKSLGHSSSLSEGNNEKMEESSPINYESEIRPEDLPF